MALHACKRDTRAVDLYDLRGANLSPVTVGEASMALTAAAMDRHDVTLQVVDAHTLRTILEQ